MTVVTLCSVMSLSESVMSLVSLSLLPMHCIHSQCTVQLWCIDPHPIWGGKGGFLLANGDRFNSACTTCISVPLLTGASSESC